jgi:SAM-dependent methyltransferase
VNAAGIQKRWCKPFPFGQKRLVLGECVSDCPAIPSRLNTCRQQGSVPLQPVAANLKAAHSCMGKIAQLRFGRGGFPLRASSRCVKSGRVIDPKEKTGKTVEPNATLLDLSSRSQISYLPEGAPQMVEEVRALQREIAALKHSYSWRITGPLRWLDRLLARRSRKSGDEKGAIPRATSATAASIPNMDKPGLEAGAPVGSLDDRTRPRARTRERLMDLLPILQCPITGERLRLLSDDALVNESSTQRWPLDQWRPIFSNNPEAIKKYPESHLSNSVASRAIELIKQSKGLALNVSAGGSQEWFPNLIEAEMAFFRNTDTIADCHALPFADGVFDVVMALNAFEHYHSPERAVQEIYRVLKPGGTVFIHTAFIQPLHEPPWHFYNCTKFGLLKWFSPFDTVDIRVSENFNPAYSLGWLAFQVRRAFRLERGEKASKAFDKTPIFEIAKFWESPAARTGWLWDEFQSLSQASQVETAAGFEYVGKKPAG